MWLTRARISDQQRQGWRRDRVRSNGPFRLRAACALAPLRRQQRAPGHRELMLSLSAVRMMKPRCRERAADVKKDLNIDVNVSDRTWRAA